MNHATNLRLTNGGYRVPKNHVIVHVRGGIVQEIDEPKGIIVEVWDHDECKVDKITKQNCPSCREPKRFLGICDSCGWMGRRTLSGMGMPCPICSAVCVLQTKKGR